MHFEFPEGATPIPDISDLLIPWVHNMSDLNRVEAENISYAQKKYLRMPLQDISIWFHYGELRVIHHSMLGKVWRWAGKQRKSVTAIGVAPGLIPLQMAELCKEVVSWSTTPIELTFLEKSARIHHRLVQIHPFENGNGRFSRLIADRCLLAWKCLYPFWPDNLHRKGEARKRYIRALQAADKGDYEPLVCFMKDLGAVNPTLSALFQDNFYRPYMESSKGVAKIEALLRNGADPNCITKKGHHLLQVIIRAKLDAQRKLEILKLLVEWGAKVNMIDKSGLTPFQVAVALGDKNIALFLRSKGACPIAPASAGYSEYYNMFLQLPLN